jgi:hypothetical protein
VKHTGLPVNVCPVETKKFLRSQALARYKRKENVVMAERAQARLAELRRAGLAAQRA